MNFDSAVFERSEYRKGLAQVVLNVLLKWALFWLQVSIPVIVFGYFYYSIMMRWHFVFFAVVFSFVWVGLLYKIIGALSTFKKYATMWMENGYDRASIYRSKRIPMWVVNGNGSIVIFGVVLVLGFVSGAFGDALSAWSSYQLPLVDPISGFWHMLMIDF